MCGRFYVADDSTDPRVQKIVAMMDRDYPGAYKSGEIFPGDTVAAVIGEAGKLRHAPAVFGFPGFQGGRLLINARAETAAKKPTFANALRERRVILPADGFYEWSRGDKKTKYLFTRGDSQTVYLCGIGKIMDGVCRFVILTRPANDSMIDIHDRMPVMVPAEEVRPYLTDYSAAQAILSSPGPALKRKEVPGDSHGASSDA